MTIPAHLAKNRRSTALAADVGYGLGSTQPPHVSILGQRFTLVDAGGNKRPAANPIELDCIILDAQKGTQRVFWGVGAVYDPDNATPPLCFSDNGVGASTLSQSPQSANCQTCPMARFDSDVSKMTGKPVPACKKVKKLAVMLPGYDFPFLLRVPIMSHDSLQTYTHQFAGGDVDICDVITRVSFVDGVQGELQFDIARYEGMTDLPYIDEGTMILRDKILDSKKCDDLVGRNDQPISPNIILAQPQVQAQPREQVAPPPPPARQIAAPQQAAPAPHTAFGAPAAPQQPAAAKPARTPRKAAAAAPAAQPATAPFRSAEAPAAAPQAQKPSFGIQSQAPAPNSELEKDLDAVFALPTETSQ